MCLSHGDSADLCCRGLNEIFLVFPGFGMYSVRHVADFCLVLKECYPFSKRNNDMELDSDFYIVTHLPVLSFKLVRTVWGVFLFYF